MKKLYILFSIVFLCSCNSGLKLSFKNGSKENYKKVTAQIGKDKYDFENLGSGEKTQSIKLKGSFPYCPVKIITEKDTLYFRPIDYLGEKFYKSGKLQMILTIEEYKNKRIVEISTKR